MSVLPVITPPFVIGLALILLFGRAGMVSNLSTRLVRYPAQPLDLRALPGLTIAQLLAFTPISYLVLLGVLNGVSPSMEEASQTLRARRWRTFRTVTWPLIRPGLANAFLIGFIESLADFGNPMMIGGNFRVLSTSIYFAVVGAAVDQGQAAVLAIVLLAFTLSAFVLQRLWLGRRSYVTVAGKGDSGVPARLPGGLRLLCYAVVLPWVVLTCAVYGVILFGGFVKAIGTDNTPTLAYFLTAFRVAQGEHGWFLAGSAWNSLITTLEVALLAMPLTARAGNPGGLPAQPAAVCRAGSVRIPHHAQLRHPRYGDRRELHPCVQRPADRADRHRVDHDRGVRVPEHAGRDPRWLGQPQPDRTARSTKRP